MPITRKIRFDCNSPLERVQERLSHLFNSPLQRGTSLDGSTVYYFKSMGIEGSVYKWDFFDPDWDPRLSRNDAVISINIYASMTGNLYDNADVVFEYAIILALMTAACMDCPVYVCSEDNEVMEEVLPTNLVICKCHHDTQRLVRGDVMSKVVRIRFGFAGTLEQAQEMLAQLFHVKTKKAVSSVYDEYFIFSSMGVQATLSKIFYYDPELDPMLGGKDLVLDISLCVPMSRCTHSEDDVILKLSSILAGMVAANFDCPAYICSEDNKVIEEVLPANR
ncbi:hypothetical protein ACYFX5_13035 [Bremerella sp. T1]|uniref:hypothetical protein n=1 Tax=Bremerella sp. TYQ1 TaxID=3119568 RepID=UPI001CD03D1B|nr:hypothetical protein [Bremerella volcania]UBM33984.1 hypothetical protein LA756_14980 [Bremerella volcania]